MTLGEAFGSVLEAARAGGDWAWAQIYRDLAPSVLGYLRAHGAHDPEDITSEVFVAMVRRLPEFDSDREEKFRSWVFVIAHRRLQDERRRLRRHPELSVPTEDLDRRAGDVEAEALESLSTQAVRDTFAQLSPDQRDVLLLRLVTDLPIDEVSSILGKSVTAIKALQRRGLASLVRILQSQAVTG